MNEPIQQVNQCSIPEGVKEAQNYLQQIRIFHALARPGLSTRRGTQVSNNRSDNFTQVKEAIKVNNNAWSNGLEEFGIFIADDDAANATFVRTEVPGDLLGALSELAATLAEEDDLVGDLTPVEQLVDDEAEATVDKDLSAGPGGRGDLLSVMQFGQKFVDLGCARTDLGEEIIVMHGAIVGRTVRRGDGDDEVGEVLLVLELVRRDLLRAVEHEAQIDLAAEFLHVVAEGLQSGRILHQRVFLPVVHVEAQGGGGQQECAEDSCELSHFCSYVVLACGPSLLANGLVCVVASV